MRFAPEYTEEYCVKFAVVDWRSGRRGSRIAALAFRSFSTGRHVQLSSMPPGVLLYQAVRRAAALPAAPLRRLKASGTSAVKPPKAVVTLAEPFGSFVDAGLPENSDDWPSGPPAFDTGSPCSHAPTSAMTATPVAIRVRIFIRDYSCPSSSV